MTDAERDEMGSPAGLPTSSMPPAFTWLHADATRLLSRWQAPTNALDATRQRMLDALASDAGAMWRHHGRTHFTASLVVLDPSASYVALTLHKKAKRWLQFGGHLEGGDLTVAAAARREGLEESGLGTLQPYGGLIHVDAHRLSGSFGWCKEHLDLRFAAVAAQPDPQEAAAATSAANLADLTVSDESDDVRWFGLDDLPGDTEPGLREAVDLARQALLSSPVGDPGIEPGRGGGSSRESGSGPEA